MGSTIFLLCRWSLPNPEYYTLRYADGPQLYITEQVSKGEASQHRPFCEVNHPGRPRCLPNLRPGSIHYLGEELLPGQMREPGLVLLSGLEHRGFHFLRAQGAGRES